MTNFKPCNQNPVLVKQVSSGSVPAVHPPIGRVATCVWRHNSAQRTDSRYSTGFEDTFQTIDRSSANQGRTSVK